ncbi:MAG: long-chain-fatty-acid--CoA ligase [Thermoplasmata archaeon]
MSAVEARLMARPWLAKYPEQVPREISIPEIALPELLRQAAERWGSQNALIYYGARWSYRAFWETTGRIAAHLAAAGWGKGDRLALYLPNTPAYPFAFFGALRAGLTVVPVSPLYFGKDLERRLRDSHPKAIVTLEILYPNLRALARTDPTPRVYVARTRQFYPVPKRWFVNLVLRRAGRSTEFPRDPMVRHFSDLLRPGTAPAVPIDPARDVAVLQYTGGTTGSPKAAMLTHRNLVANALQCRAWFAIQPPGTGVVLAAIPFFHVYGMTVAMNFPISEGAAIVLQNRPDVSEILKLIARWKPTEFPGVPALYQGINEHPRTPKYDIRSIRVCLSGSAPLPTSVARRFEELTGGYLVEGYGLTEASPVTHANPIQGERREGSVGLPLPGTDQKIVDPEEGRVEMPVGTPGELWVRGPQVMAGYLGEETETAQVLHDGWLSTGDIARLDRDGYAYLVDRKKDLIDVGGFKVYPTEVEELLRQHPAVKEVAVLGLPDPKLGEVVAAFVVRAPGSAVTAAELIEFARSRITHYKAPRRIEFRTELPRSAVQKVLRRALRAEFEGSARPSSDPGGPGSPAPWTPPAPDR